jgi:hypothetical protein
VVLLADRDAAAGQDQVVVCRGGAQAGTRRVARVGHDAKVVDHAAESFEQAAQRVAVGVVDAARLERLARHRQFVAGGEQRHAQAAEHRELRQPTEAATPTWACGEARAGGQHFGAGGDVLAAPADPLAGMRHMVHGDGIAVMRTAPASPPRRRRPAPARR